MHSQGTPITVDVVVIGGGQAGMAAGYYLRRSGRDFVILDAETAPGGSWQHYWGLTAPVLTSRILLAARLADAGLESRFPARLTRRGLPHRLRDPIRPTGPPPGPRHVRDPLR